MLVVWQNATWIKEDTVDKMESRMWSSLAVMTKVENNFWKISFLTFRKYIQEIEGIATFLKLK